MHTRASSGAAVRVVLVPAVGGQGPQGAAEPPSRARPAGGQGKHRCSRSGGDARRRQHATRFPRTAQGEWEQSWSREAQVLQRGVVSTANAMEELAYKTDFF